MKDVDTVRSALRQLEQITRGVAIPTRARLTAQRALRALKRIEADCEYSRDMRSAFGAYNEMRKERVKEP